MIRLSAASNGSASGAIFRRSTFPTHVLEESRFRHVACSKRSCGFSTQVRNGTLLPQTYPNYKTGIETRFVIGLLLLKPHLRPFGRRRLRALGL